MNLYRTAKDGIAKHSNDDVSSQEKIGVVAILYGASRILSFRPINRNDSTLKQLNIQTESGQTLVMYGQGFQNKFNHAIAGQKPKKPPDEPGEDVATATKMEEMNKTARVLFTF